MGIGAANTFRVSEDNEDSSLGAGTPPASALIATAPVDSCVATGAVSVTAGVESFDPTNSYIGEGRLV